MTQAQHRALLNCRNRLSADRLIRFNVLGRKSDRELIRSVAGALADTGAAAERLRATIMHALDLALSRKGRILAALCNAPLAGSELKLRRSRATGRKVDL